MEGILGLILFYYIIWGLCNIVLFCYGTSHSFDDKYGNYQFINPDEKNYLHNLELFKTIVAYYANKDEIIR